MCKDKRVWKGLLWAVVAVSLLLPCSVQAQGSSSVTEEQASWETYTEETWELLQEALPEETAEALQQAGLDAPEAEQFLNLSWRDFGKVLLTGWRTWIRTPLTTMLQLLGVVLCCALFSVFRQSERGSASGSVMEVVSVLCLSGIFMVPLMQTLEHTVSFMEKTGRFMLSFVPIYAGILSVSGKPLSAFAYQSFLVGVIEVILLVCQNLLMPLTGAYLALCIAGAASWQIRMEGLTKSLKSLILWCLGLFLSLFVGILSVKGFVANAADSVTYRTGKYLVSSLVPIVGGAISDAFSTVQGSLGILKSTVGAFGILAVCLCFLPLVAELLLLRLALKGAELGSQILQLRKVLGLLENAGFVLTLLLAFVICFAVLFVIAVSFLLMLGQGGV